MTSISVAFLSPEHDRTEQVLGQWSSSLVSMLSGDSRFTVISDVRGGMASMRPLLSKHVSGADYILYFGHAQPDHLGSPVEIMTISDGLLAGSACIAAIACHAGAQLGPDLVRQTKVSGFLGFDDQFCVYLANPQVFGSVIIAAIRELLDPASSGEVALKVLKDGFRGLRQRYQAVERDPKASLRQRYAAHEIWLASYPNELTAVWIAPPGGGGGSERPTRDQDEESRVTTYRW